MQCVADNSAQVLTDKNDKPIQRKVPLFLRYPSDQRHLIPGHAKEEALKDARNYILIRNESAEQAVELYDVNIMEIIEKDTDNDCLIDGSCHWQFRGEANYEMFVKCLKED